MRRRIFLLALVLGLAGIASPALGVVNWVQRLDTAQWDSLWTNLAATTGGPRIAGTATTPPSGVAGNKYARVVTVGTMNAQQLRDTVVAALADPNAFVAINEIASDTNATIAQAANLIGTGYPNRWGAFVTYGSGATGPRFDYYATAINAVYANHGRLMPEFYPRYTKYWTCNNEENNPDVACANDADRDNWMNNTFFRGTGKLSWLMQQKPAASQSKVNPIFGVGNTYLNSTNETSNQRFLDRMFFVFVTKSQYRSLALYTNDGGIGSYKWSGIDNVHGQGTISTRDNIFAILWKRYAGNATTPGATTPNWSGAMPAPVTGAFPPPAPGWQDTVSLGSQIVGSPTIVTWGAGTMDAFARGTDNGLWQTQYRNGAWSGWISLGGQITSSPGAVAWGPGRIDIFAKGTNNDLVHKYYDGANWSGWESLGGTINAAPTVTTWGPGTLDVFARGSDNALWQLQYRNAWAPWYSHGGVLNSAPSAVAWAPGRIDIFARGTGNDLIQKYYDGVNWSGWASFGGGLASAPAVTTWGPGTLDVFARGSDSLLWQIQYRNGWSGWISHGRQIDDAPGAVSWGSGRIDIIMPIAGVPWWYGYR